MKERMLFRASKCLSYEAHLQAYFLQNCDKAPLKDLTGLQAGVPLWIGNEVSCGVGMQSIDVLLSQESPDAVRFNIIELKCVNPYRSIIDYQLPRYVTWVKDYLAPLYDKQVIITPTILAPRIHNPAELQDFKNACLAFESSTLENITVNPIAYIGYTISDDIAFEKVL